MDCHNTATAAAAATAATTAIATNTTTNTTSTLIYLTSPHLTSLHREPSSTRRVPISPGLVTPRQEVARPDGAERRGGGGLTEKARRAAL